MIEVERISKRYGPSWAVRDVSFRVERGEILGLLGANGAGKTTIMRMLTGFIPPTEGAARIAGFDVVRQPLEARRRVGYLPESVPLYREMKVRPFLRFVADIKGLPSAAAPRAADQAIEELNLGAVANRIVGNLSRGYRQRVGIAQALVGDPEVVILDEPTVGLDPAQVVETRALIRGMTGRRAVVLSTHILPEVAATCGRVVILNRGAVVAWGDPRHLSAEFRVRGRIEATVGNAPHEEAARTLAALPEIVEIVEVRPRPDATVFVLQGTEEAAPSIARAVVAHGWRLLDLREAGDTLEDVFMQAVTGKTE